MGGAQQSFIGIRVKSGWASAIVIAMDNGKPRFVRRAKLSLSDPKVPKSSQPYHRGFGRLQTDQAIIARLTAIVERAADESLAALADECRRASQAVSAVALVVGSTIDPERIANEHIRAHASDARLFRTVLERAAERAGLPWSVVRERDLPARADKELGPAGRATAHALGTAAGRPWRADEKLATLAAWLAALARP